MFITIKKFRINQSNDKKNENHSEQNFKNYYNADNQKQFKKNKQVTMIALYIILIILFVIILTGINIYLLALYCHPDDKGWGNVVYCKILVVVGLTLCQAQALMVPLDVANESALLMEGGLDMQAFWTFLYITVLIMITILLPYALFLYQTDEDDPMRKRLCTALCYTFGAIIISVMLLFISWAVFKWVNIPYTEKALNFTSNKFTKGNTNIAVPQPASSDKEIQLEASLAVYIMAILSFFGWILLVIFGGVGLFALPIDMINEFRHRPKLRRSAQMRKVRDALASAVESLHKEGEQLRKQDEENHKNKEEGFLSKWKTNRSFGKKMTQFKAKYHAIEEEITVFKIQLQFADSNPIIPWLKLLVGIIFSITALLWIIQIIFGNIVKAYTGNPRPLIPFFNELLIGLEQKNAGFLATFIFAYLCLYMLWAVQKGNIKFGIRIPLCCRFHPMKENETWMNSFLFNVILLLIASVGVIQLCIASFPTYTRNSDIYMIFGNTIRYMYFYNFFYEKNVFAIAFVTWSLLTLIYMLITLNKKPAYMKEIERIRKEKNYQKQMMEEK